MSIHLLTYLPTHSIPTIHSPIYPSIHSILCPPPTHESIYLSTSSTQLCPHPFALPGVSPKDLEPGKYIERPWSQRGSWEASVESSRLKTTMTQGPGLALQETQSLLRAPPSPSCPQIYSSNQPLRIGYCESDGFTQPSPSMARAMRLTSRLLQDAGHQVGLLSPE